MFEKLEFELCGRPAIAIHHPDKQFRLSCIPSAGGHIQQINICGQELLDGFANQDELENNEWGKSGLLYPFPNRLKGGEYEWKGKTYNFPINEVSTGSALHGFGMQRSLRIENVDLKEEEAIIQLSGKYEGDRDYYPWPFDIEVNYRLSLEEGFSMNLTIKNSGKTPIPMGMGWHPYFWLGDDPKAARLQLPKLAKVVIDRNMIPTGSLVTMDDFQTAKSIEDYQLDTGFKLFKPGKRAEVDLEIPGKGRLNYWQESGHEKFKFLQVFIPPHRKSIALEPMTCNIDAFNNGQGLIELKPGKMISASCGVNFKAN